MSKSKKPFTDVESLRTIDRSIAEHEIFLSFTHDDDAAEFDGWWNTKGCVLFNQHLEAVYKRRRELS